MARPTVGRAAEELYSHLIAFAAVDGEETNWDLLRLCEALMGGTFDQIFGYVTDDGDRPGWAIVFDPDICPPEALPYLAQFVGERLEAELTEELQRAVIQGPRNWSRGTLTALIAALEPELTGGKSILVDERYEGSAYRLRVRTFLFETPDPARALQKVLSQKPAGITLTYAAIVGQDWGDLVAAYDTWDDVVAAYPTWDDVMADLP